MDKTLQKALYVILISLGLAFIFNFLFFSKMLGISVFIFAVILLGVLYFFGRKELPLKNAWWLGLFFLFFMLMPAVRANNFLNFLNIVASLGLLVLLALELTGTPAFLLKIRDYIILAILTPLRMLGRAFFTFGQIGQLHSSVKNRDIWIRVLKGFIMAVPILIVFGILFSQADLAFSRFINSFVHITISERTAQYGVLLFVAFVSSLGFLSFIFLPKEAKPTLVPEQANTAVQSGKGIEVLVFLGLIGALFLVFIVFQITYLFGGESNIINAGFTYAEYARRGFWELLAVTILSLLVLLASEKYDNFELKRDKKFLIPALILIAEVFVVMVSAFKRLSLYIDAYSLTDMRFYVAAFIILLFVLFILLAIKFIKAKPEHFFTFGTLLSVLAFLVAINLLNPDSFIAKSNLKQYTQTGKIDTVYVRYLSADAEKEKIELYYKLPEAEKESYGRALVAERIALGLQSSDWQSANFSRTRALKLLEEFAEKK